MNTRIARLIAHIRPGRLALVAFSLLALPCFHGSCVSGERPAPAPGSEAKPDRVEPRGAPPQATDGKKPAAATSVPDSHLLEKELIKDRFKGTVEEYWQGEATIRQLAKALEDAEKDLAAFPRTAWNEEFELSPSGLNNARVQVIKEFGVPEAKAWAFGNLDRAEEGRLRLQALLDQAKSMPRDKLIKNRVVDLRKTYDEILEQIPETIAKLENLSSLVKRTPPAGEINYLELEQKFWQADEGLSWSMANGTLQIEGKKGYCQITAMHYYLKDVRLRVGFQINEGGFDIHLRCLPGGGSTFQFCIARECFPEPLVLTFVVAGNHMQIEGPDGLLLDEFDVVNAPAGGGISFWVKEGASVAITELAVEGDSK
jgi:hypothetical protein